MRSGTAGVVSKVAPSTKFEWHCRMVKAWVRFTAPAVFEDGVELVPKPGARPPTYLALVSTIEVVGHGRALAKCVDCVPDIVSG